MWKVSYQKFMAIILSSRYIPENEKGAEEISGNDLFNQLKAAQKYYE